MVLILKKRDVLNRLYYDDKEFIFEVGKYPTAEELKTQVIEKLQLREKIDEIVL
jgi:hypothetical protein